VIASCAVDKDGSTDAFTVGGTVGLLDGGVTDGFCVGDKDGWDDAFVGGTEGFLVGESVGCTVGLLVGESVGCIVGVDTGIEEGKKVGFVLQILLLQIL
jgi:hypothetical protein